MASLIDLGSYKIISEKQLIDNYNLLVDALNSNFDFTLDQVASPIPDPALGTVNDVLTIKPGFTLGYESLNTLINVQSVFSAFLATGPQQLRLDNNLTIGLLASSQMANEYVIAATLPGGTVQDKVVFKQLSGIGDMQELHTVKQFQVTANNASLTVSTGYFQVNALQVATYQLPTNAPTVNQILQANASGNLEFQTPFQPVTFDGSQYAFATKKPLAFLDVSYPAYNIQFNGSTGIGYTSGWTDNSARLYFDIAGQPVMQLVKPEDVLGNSVKPYVQMAGALALASSSNIDPLSNPIGGLWYDPGIEGLVVNTASGRKYISSQSLAASVNTEESKDFVLQPASTLSVDAGTEQKPALNIGTAGLTSDNSSLKIIVQNTAIAQISSEGLASANALATGTAKVVLTDSVGINNPAKPTYAFSGSEGLGVFRSNTDALAVAVKGQAVIEFSEAKVNVKGSQVSNVGAPVEPADAANKEYVDARIPIGTTPGALPIVSSGSTSKYVQSDAKYLNGTLEIGSSSAPASFRMNSSSGGAAIIKAPSTVNNVVFELPSNSLNNGVLQSVNGRTQWVDINSLTTNVLKADGTVQLSKGLNTSSDSAPANPLIGKSGTGMYASTESSVKVGFSASGKRLLEANASTDALVGATDSFNAPYIRLSNTISNYSSVLSTGVPTYAFAGESQTGVGQTQVQSVSLIVNGAAKLSAGTNGLSAHNNRVIAVADPVQSSDVATKNYVDTMVKPRKELSFLVQSLPVGWSVGSAIILSIYDKALIFSSATGVLTYESASDNKLVVVPSDFSTNPDCQVYVDNLRLVKMAKTSGVREVTYGTPRSIILNYNLSVGQVVTIHLPG